MKAIAILFTMLLVLGLASVGFASVLDATGPPGFGIVSALNDVAVLDLKGERAVRYVSATWLDFKSRASEALIVVGIYTGHLSSERNAVEANRTIYRDKSAVITFIAGDMGGAPLAYSKPWYVAN